jgi:hypothetical protein
MDGLNDGSRGLVGGDGKEGEGKRREGIIVGAEFYWYEEFDG